jgi:hypothetical protein
MERWIEDKPMDNSWLPLRLDMLKAVLSQGFEVRVTKDGKYEFREPIDTVQ